MAFKAVAVVLLVACLLASSGADDVVDPVIGTTLVHLKSLPCHDGECNLANLVNEAMVKELATKGEFGSWTAASIAATNVGAFRDSLTETNRPGGAITYNDLNQVLPWNDTCDYFELKGGVILEVLEHSAAKFGTPGFMHWAGLKVRYDMAAPVKSRVKCASVLCRRCRVPQYEAINVDEWYRVTVNNFITNGGDGYKMFLPNLRNRVVGRTDMQVVGDYITKTSPITQGLDGRIEILNSAYIDHLGTNS